MVFFGYTWPAFVSLFIASRASPNLLLTLKLVLAVTFVGFSIYFINDVMDFDYDLINKEFGNLTQAGRPLQSGAISKSIMIMFGVFSAFFGLLLASSINLQVLILQLIFLLLGVLYSTKPFRFKSRFFIKNLTISAGVMISILSGGLSLGVLNTQILYLLTMNGFFSLVLTPVADIRDIEGDKKSGIKSIPIVWGPEMTIRLTLSVIVATEVATLIGYSRLGFTVALPILLTLISGSLIYTVFPLLKKWNDPVFTQTVLVKKIYPLYLLLQIPVLIGVLPISFF